MPSPFLKVKVMDEKLTAKIQAYLDAAPEDKNVIEGARGTILTLSNPSTKY